jgi:predicted DNA-binding transcriptional regulator AlpA
MDMSTSSRLTAEQRVDIMRAYGTDLVPMIELAKRYGKSRQRIYRIISQAGIPRTERFKVSCSCCGEEIERVRCQVRNRKHLFCSTACYYAYLDAGNGRLYVQNRLGQRIAREKVERVFALQPGHIVHHEDRNTLNNDLSNLKVFANQGDHVRHHRGCDAVPLWEGSKVQEKPRKRQETLR